MRVRLERLLAAAPLVLRFATDRRRCAPASSLACGQAVELACCLPGVRNAADEPSGPFDVAWSYLVMVRLERFELPAFWFVARRSIQLSYRRITGAAKRLIRQ